MDLIQVMAALYPVVFLVGLLTGIFGTVLWCNQRARQAREIEIRRRADELSERSAKLLADLDALTNSLSVISSPPRFGTPTMVLYNPDEWLEPLLCNGGCKLPQIQGGQAIWLIPLADGSGELPYCLDCVPMPQHMVEAIAEEVQS